MLLSGKELSDFEDADFMLDQFPKAKALIDDRGSDVNLFLNAMMARGIASFIESKVIRTMPLAQDKVLYHHRY